MEGEAILINLANGIYYSMDKVGGKIWECIELEQRLEQIIETVVASYDVSQDRAKKDIESLLSQLLEENLIVLKENGESTSFNGGEQPKNTLPYESPTLNIYRDMGDLLALDPPMPGMAETPWQNQTGEESGVSCR
jgi:hypothetical protein